MKRAVSADRGPRTRPRAAAALLAAGTLAALVIAEGALRVGGWAYLRRVRARGPAADGAGVVRVLCLGESTTAFGGDNSYPRQLERILNAPGAPQRYRVINGGIPGVDSADIIDILPAYLAEHKPHLVVAMMGANDYLPRPPSRLRDLASGLRLVKVARLIRYRVKGVNSLAILPPAPPPLPPRPGPPVPPMGIETDYERARKMESKGDLEGAEQAYRAILAARPDFAKAAHRLARIRRDSGRDAETDALPRSSGGEREVAGPASGPGERLPDPAVMGQLDAAARELSRPADENFDRAVEALAMAPVRPGTPLDLPRLREIARLAERNVYPYRVERVLSALGMLCLRSGNEAAAGEFLDAARERRVRFLNPMTVGSWGELCRALDERGTPLIAVSYPMRDTAPLRRLLGARSDSVILVDNGEPFRDALRRESAEALFDDLFGGDFGHCSPRGNLILAGRVADAVRRAAGGGYLSGY